MPVLITRASTYIHGAGADSYALANHLHSFLSRRWRSQPAASPAGAGRGIDDSPRPAGITGQRASSALSAIGGELVMTKGAAR